MLNKYLFKSCVLPRFWEIFTFRTLRKEPDEPLNRRVHTIKDKFGFIILFLCFRGNFNSSGISPLFLFLSFFSSLPLFFLHFLFFFFTSSGITPEFTLCFFLYLFFIFLCFLFFNLLCNYSNLYSFIYNITLFLLFGFDITLFLLFNLISVIPLYIP